MELPTTLQLPGGPLVCFHMDGHNTIVLPTLDRQLSNPQLASPVAHAGPSLEVKVVPSSNESKESKAKEFPAEIDAKLKELRGSRGLHGLTLEEVKSRQLKYGKNALEETVENPCKKFLRYFYGPIPFMIEGACILAGALQKWEDFGIIIVLLFVNAILGFMEERNASAAIAALKAGLPSKCRANRDGHWSDIEAADLVPGDRIIVKGGDAVPADCIIVEIDEKEQLEVDQSALTGESLAVHRAHGEKLFSSSLVKANECEAVVIATGSQTFIGETAHLVNSSHSSGQFQKVLTRIGNFLILSDFILVLVIIGFSVFNPDKSGNSFWDVIQFCLVLTIASIPVAMPTVLSVTMALGARQLAKRNVIVSRLTAIEELAGIEILCSDKTGTLTKNQLKVDEYFVMDGYTEDALLLSCAFACNWHGNEVIDSCILKHLKTGGDAVARRLGTDVLTRYEQIGFKPFNPIWKRTEGRIRGPDGQERVYSKGAPQVMARLLTDQQPNDPEAAEIAKKFTARVDSFAERGLRCLGVAELNAKKQWVLVGLVSLLDPPRDDSAATIAALKDLGIRVKMITGDQVKIGQEVAKRLGMGTNILNCSTLDGHVQGGQTIAERIESADGFGEVFPAHKHMVVSVLQQRGYLVGMTGDGVNDAPALKQANVGIAVAGATDAARAAASMVLLTPGLSVITEGVLESRRIFGRMLSYASYRVATTVHMLLFLTISILAFKFYLPAIQIVLIALLNDFSIICISFDNVKPGPKPLKWNLPSLIGTSTVLGLVMVFASVLILSFARDQFGLSLDEQHTILYLQISVGGHLVVFATRSGGESFLSGRKPSLVFFLSVIGTQFIATLLSVYGGLVHAVGWKHVGYVWAFCVITFLILDAVKQVVHKLFTHDGDAGVHSIGAIADLQAKIGDSRVGVSRQPSFNATHKR